MSGTRIDFDAINAAALAAYPGLLQEWFPNGRIVSGELCAGDWSGNPGNSLKINIKTGVGKDWADDAKGVSDPVATYAKRFGVDMGEAARCIAARLGIGNDHGPAQHAQREHARATAAAVTTAPPRQHVPGEIDPERKAKVDKMLAGCSGIRGTPGETYFRNRGLRGAPGARWRDMPRSPRCAGSVVTTATTDDGTVLAIQQTYITTEGRKADVDVQKRTNGTMHLWAVRAACRIPPAKSQAGGPIVAAEGFEDGVTIRQCTGLECWACYGIANIAHAPFPAGRPIIVARDNDAPGSDADKSVIRVMATLIERGYTVLCARPPQGFKDANAVLTELGDAAGSGAVVDMINHAKPVADLREASDEGLPEAIEADQLQGDALGIIDHSDDPLAAELSDYLQSDTGNARRICRRFGHLIIHAEGIGWHIYEKGAWRQDRNQRIMLMGQHIAELVMNERNYLDPDTAKERAKWSLKSQMAPQVRNMIALAAPRVSMLASGLDPDPMYLNCANGYVDLATGKLLPHDAAKYMTQQVPVPYDPHAKCPAWEKFIREIFRDDHDLAAYVQRAIGYSLTGDTSEQIMFLCYGIGANGKNTLLDTVAALASGYWKKTVTNLLMAKERPSAGAANPELAMLRGARLVTASESGEQRRLDEALIKEVTGDASITVRTLYGQPFTFTPQFKLWLATNHKPDIRGTDEGIWRRLKLIEFGARFHDPDDPDVPEGSPLKNKMLPAKLLTELPGILAWCVRGAVAWKRDGLSEPSVIREAVKEYRSEQDIVGQFISERCVFRADFRIKKSELRAAYNSWAKENGFFEISAKKLTQELKSRGISGGHDEQADRIYQGVDIRAKTSERN